MCVIKKITISMLLDIYCAFYMALKIGTVTYTMLGSNANLQMHDSI